MQEHHCAESPSSVSAFGAATFPRGKAGVVAVGLAQPYYIVTISVCLRAARPTIWWSFCIHQPYSFGAADKASNNPIPFSSFPLSLYVEVKNSWSHIRRHNKTSWYLSLCFLWYYYHTCTETSMLSYSVHAMYLCNSNGSYISIKKNTFIFISITINFQIVRQ